MTVLPRDDAPVRRCDRPLGQRLDTVAAADHPPAGDGAERRGGDARRRRLRRAEHVRRAGADPGPRPGRRTGPALQPVPHDGAVLADAGRAADRAQPPQRAHGRHRRDRLRLPRLRRDDPAQHRHDRRGAAAATATARRCSARRTSRRCGRPARPGPSTAGRRAWASTGSTASSVASASQWEPALYDQTTPIEPYVGRDDYHLTEDLADQAIEWMRLQKAVGTGQAVLPVLLAGRHATRRTTCGRSGSTGSAGSSTTGGTSCASRSTRASSSMGVIPRGTMLTPRPEQLPAWDDYDDRYKPVAARLMEVLRRASSPTPTPRSGGSSTSSRASGVWTTPCSST